MSVNPKYYYNLSGNISDGKKEYSLHHKEDKIGGLSISSGLKENYIEYGTNSLLDLLNELNDENHQLKKQREELFIRERNTKNKLRGLQERNNRQCKQLDNLYTLIEKQDWKTLTEIIQELKEADERLQKEWSE